VPATTKNIRPESVLSCPHQSSKAARLSGGKSDAASWTEGGCGRLWFLPRLTQERYADILCRHSSNCSGSIRLRNEAASGVAAPVEDQEPRQDSEKGHSEPNGRQRHGSSQGLLQGCSAEAGHCRSKGLQRLIHGVVPWNSWCAKAAPAVACLGWLVGLHWRHLREAQGLRGQRGGSCTCASPRRHVWEPCGSLHQLPISLSRCIGPR